MKNEYSKVCRIRGGKCMDNKTEKNKVEARHQNDFKSAVRRGVIMQLYKEDYLSEAQYTQLLKNPPKRNTISHII